MDISFTVDNLFAYFYIIINLNLTYLFGFNFIKNTQNKFL
jgi:hypothetical protein